MGLSNSTCASPGENGYSCLYTIVNFTSNDAFGQLNVTELPSLPSNPDIGGTGIFTAFCISFFTSSLLAIIIHVYEYAKKIGNDLSQIAASRWDKWIHTSDSLLVGWSDAAIVLGIATSVAALRGDGWCQFSVYHKNLICQWLILCSVTHANALLVHCRYFKHHNRWANGLRLTTIGIHILLTAIVFYRGRDLTGPTSWYPSITDQTPLQILSANCFMKNATISQALQEAGGWRDTFYSNEALFLTSFLVVILSLLNVLLNLVGKRRTRVRQYKNTPLSWWIRTVLLMANIAVGCCAFGFTLTIRDWIHGKGKHSEMMWMADDNERKYSYGQYVPLFLSFLVIFGALQGFADNGLLNNDSTPRGGDNDPEGGSDGIPLREGGRYRNVD